MPLVDTPPPRRLAASLLARQGLGFLIVGGIQLVLDWSVFVLFSSMGMEVVAANLLGRASGAVLGFWLNANYTFRDPGSGDKPRGWSNGVKFLVGWALMTVLSTLCVSWVDHAVGLRWAWIGKPVIDGVLAVLGFALSKYWIFR